MATKNSLSNRSQELTLDPGAAGDSVLQFSINGTGEFRIGVDDTDDSFRISQGSALGTNDTFVMSDAGERTMPLQAAFLAVLPSTDDNVTGEGTVWTLGSVTALTEIFDQNGDFNTNGTFTAPVTGRYKLTMAFNIKEDETPGMASTDCEISILTSNRTWNCLKENPSVLIANKVDMLPCATIFVDMDIGDTAVSRVMCDGAGSKLVDVYGIGTRSHFSGSLIC